jgi:hypothetical protein
MFRTASSGVRPRTGPKQAIRARAAGECDQGDEESPRERSHDPIVVHKPAA